MTNLYGFTPGCPSRMRRFPAWRTPVGMLLSVALHACGAHETEVKVPQPAAQASPVFTGWYFAPYVAPPVPTSSAQMPPGVRPPPECAALGIPNEPDRVFEHDGKYCGCHEGKAHCRDTNDMCFNEGVWHDKGAEFQIGGRICDCRKPPQWDCGVYSRGCSEIGLVTVIEFDLGSARLSASAGMRIDKIVQDLVNAPLRLVALQAQAASNEPNPTSLARSRANAVRAELVRKGIDERRILMKIFGSAPIPIPHDIHVKPCTDTSALNAVPRVVYAVGTEKEIPSEWR